MRGAAHTQPDRQGSSPSPAPPRPASPRPGWTLRGTAITRNTHVAVFTVLAALGWGDAGEDNHHPLWKAGKGGGGQVSAPNPVVVRPPPCTPIRRVDGDAATREASPRNTLMVLM